MRRISGKRGWARMRGRVTGVLLVIGLAGGCSSAPPEKSSAGVASAATSPQASGRTPSGKVDPGEVQSAWWSWAAGSPSGRNPVEDATGAHCAAGQPRGRWFLAGTFGGSVERRCTVPSGRPLVAPVVNLFGSETDCAEFMAVATGTLTVDGKTVPVQRWRATAITIAGVAGNPVTRTEEPMDVFGCGLWAVVSPLPSGSHEVRIRGAGGEFKVAVDYDLTVTT